MAKVLFECLGVEFGALLARFCASGAVLIGRSGGLLCKSRHPNGTSAHMMARPMSSKPEKMYACPSGDVAEWGITLWFFVCLAYILASSLAVPLQHFLKIVGLVVHLSRRRPGDFLALGPKRAKALAWLHLRRRPRRPCSAFDISVRSLGECPQTLPEPSSILVCSVLFYFVLFCSVRFCSTLYHSYPASSSFCFTGTPSHVGAGFALHTAPT